ncbi:transglycosylase family protein [Luteococcus peritonei]|uniref:Transglycosylase family protein n=1 Tax=Luteococcus peritonei TaxID=88874 RepID=A0ABW4RZD3_9ACTN
MNKSTTIVSMVAATALSAGVGLATAAPAEAAGTVWDRVAKCESGGNWSINTGNGYHGGLQFSRQTWLAYGGGKYAPTANRATKAQQIAIAKKTLQGQGPGAWPVCSRKAGLTRANGLAAYTGSTTTAKPAKKATAKKASTSTKKATAKKAAPAVKGARYVTVKSGDTLSKIAKRNGKSWQSVWSLNKASVRNPNVIKVGQKIRVA